MRTEPGGKSVRVDSPRGDDGKAIKPPADDSKPGHYSPRQARCPYCHDLNARYKGTMNRTDTHYFVCVSVRCGRTFKVPPQNVVDALGDV